VNALRMTIGWIVTENVHTHVLKHIHSYTQHSYKHKLIYSIHSYLTSRYITTCDPDDEATNTTENIGMYSKNSERCNCQCWVSVFLQAFGTWACVYVCVYVYVYVYVHMYVCMYGCMYVCICIGC